MEPILSSAKSFIFAKSNTKTEADPLEILSNMRQQKCILQYDFNRLVYGDLQKYAPAVAEAVRSVSFIKGLPEVVDSYSDDELRLGYQQGLARIGNEVSKEVFDHSPFRTANLLPACLYDLFYKALCKTGPVRWDDEQTQRIITDLAKMVRFALGKNNAVHKGMQDSTELPTGGQHFHVIQHAYGVLGTQLNIPLEKYPHLGLRFCIEKNVIDAAQVEFGFDPTNPLLIFMFDKEKNYAEGMAQGWLAALRLVERLKSEGLGSLTVKDIEDLHKACAADVESTLGYGVSSEMGASSVTYAVTETHGLTKQGRKERKAFYDRMNKDSTILTQQSDKQFRGKDNQLFTLGIVSGSGVYMCRNSLFKKQEDNTAHVRQLAGNLIERFCIMLEQAAHEGDDATRKEGEALAIIALCQSMERLHPFEDANGRVFEFLLPNALLLALGQEAYAPCDPYLFDGASLYEVSEELRQGQAEVKKMRDACSGESKAEMNLESPAAKLKMLSQLQ